MKTDLKRQSLCLKKVLQNEKPFSPFFFCDLNERMFIKITFEHVRVY